MKKQLFLILTLLLSILLLSGCKVRQSSDFNTQALTVNMSVIADGGGNTNIEVKILQGETLLYPVLLVSGDDLYTDAYGETIMLNNSGSQTSPIYTGYFSSDVNLEEFTIRLERANETSAPQSTVILPEGFEISSPTAGDIVSQTGTIEILWDSMSIYAEKIIIKGECLDENGEPFMINFSLITNSGSENILISDILAGFTLSPTENCSVDIIIERQNIGSIDPNFESGSIIAKQVRSANIIITP